MRLFPGLFLLAVIKNNSGLPANELFCGIAQEILYLFVDKSDYAVLGDGDDGVHAFDQQAVLLLRDLQRLLHPDAFGHVREREKESGYVSVAVLGGHEVQSQ